MTRNNVGKKRGFTLLELLVTLAIFIIMTTILLANQRRFSNTLDLTNLAYDISLSIRQAQTYGFAVRADTSTGSNTFQNYYGVHFDMSDPTKFRIFADIPSGSDTPNGLYDGESVDKTVNIYNLKNNFTIKEICNVDSGSCANQPSNKVDIVFKRPNPDAYISFLSGSTVTSAPETNNHIRIKLKSSDNKLKAIDIYRSGQISVVDITN